MSKIVATACPAGVTMPGPFTCEMEITTDIPADVVGECVTNVINMAWTAGHDPAVSPFVVLVSFSQKD